MPSRTFALIVAIAVSAGFGASYLEAQVPYPQISALRNEDALFAQLEESIERSRVALKAPGRSTGDELVFYCYRLPRESNAFEVAAAFSLPYDTIATLNRLDGPGSIPAGTLLVVPSAPGVFVPQKPKTELEFLMRSLWAGEAPQGLEAKVRLGDEEVAFRFYPGAQFHASERTFFLVAGFRFPLPKGVITSSFGARVDPFTGKSVKFHAGIDIGAPYGTQVFAARAGKIETTGYSEVYGNYILISHGSEWETLYGHLSKILAVPGKRVEGGEIIGLVGSTGMSTGPHLHFETRRKGVATDPARLIAVPEGR